MIRISIVPLLGIWMLAAVPLLGAEEQAPDYSTEIVPIFQKYCVGCHNDDDREGQLSLSSFEQLQKGGENGLAVLAGDAKASRLVRVLTGEAEPKMPPEDNKAPTEPERELLKAWIAAGAPGPNGKQPDRTILRTPKIQTAAAARQAITSVAWSPTEDLVAVARFGSVELLRAGSLKPVRMLRELPGKVNQIEFSRDGKKLVAAAGVAGLYGRATIFNVADGAAVAEFTGHRDTMYAATLSAGGKRLATASYDKQIILWNVEGGEQIRTFNGHNDAVYDLAFSPDDTVLASASGDETVKLWHVESGIRLDTLSQPLAEQFTVAFSPDGRYVLAGGADNRLRVWRFVSKKKPRINPLVHARFAHEGAITQLAFSRDGRALASAAEDRTLKLWETRGFTQTFAFEQQPDIAQAVTFNPQGKNLLVGRLDGSLQSYAVKETTAKKATTGSTASPVAVADTPMTTAVEQEPNDLPSEATPVQAPATVAGVIHVTRESQSYDEDLFRFSAKAGQEWVIETNAARSKSPLDTKIELLDSAGRPVPRVLLQAVRDSYFKFRGKDSKTSGDFRVHNWEEMELNELLFANGEVVKLFHYPRGPDSGFLVYPGKGDRHTLFDTTANAHALHAPCYIVKPHPPATKLIANGLPTFTLHYENDDDSRRKLGTDSRLTFTAPADGEYLVRVRDVRGFHGEQHKYKLTIRARRPDFKVTLNDANPTVGAGSGKEFHVRAERIDGFDGPIRVDITDVPPGFHVTSPLVIQAGHLVAFGTINALPDAAKPTEQNAKISKVTAIASVNEKTVTKTVNNLGEIKLADKPKVLVRIVRADQEPAAVPSPDQPLELEITPGQTIMAKVVAERNGFDARIALGSEDSGRNLPHGVYVDNIGLNGLMIVEGKNERTFFITAADWVPETTRKFHLKANVEGGQATWPVILHVRNSGQLAGKSE